MDHLVDYIKWMGDVPFRGLPLNEADALVLCMLSYYDFAPLFQGKRKRLPLRESLRQLPDCKDRRRFVSDTGELLWDFTREGCGYFTVNSKRTKLFTGFADGREIRLDQLTLAEIGSDSGAVTISAVCTDGSDFASPGRSLIAATGTSVNRDAVFELLDGNKATLRKNWGANSPVLCEGVSARLLFAVPPARLQVFALDSNGARRTELPTEEEGGKAVVRLSPAHRTLWYEVVIK